MLRRLSRATTLAGVLVGAIVVGLIAFTALGVGGGAPKGRPIAVHRPRHPQIYVAHPLSRTRRGLSESIGQREGGGANGPGAPLLDEQVPFEPRQFDGPIARYRDYAAGQVALLEPAVAALAAAVRSGDRRQARAAWRIAFARYLRLGAVYGALGSLDGAIDGLAGHLPDGTRDRRFTGLHRAEMGLWSHRPVTTLVPVVRRLARDVTRLHRAVRTADITPLDYATRAHEILEDAQRDFLSGTAVPWSHEGVLATSSALAATQVVIRTLHPLLKGQQSEPTTQAGLARLRATLRALRAAHGGRLPTLDALTHRQHERLVGSIGWALERLQQIPGSLETMDAPRIPTLRAG